MTNATMADVLHKGRAGARLTDYPVIDLHGHVGEADFGIPHGNAAALVGDMDRLGVQCIMVSSLRCMSAQAEAGNREVMAAIDAFPGRILGYASFWPTTAAQVEERAAYWLEQGFSGLKFHNHIGHPYSHPAYQRAYALADEHCLPMLFHTWGNEEEFADIAAIARSYPRTSILLAHAGSANEAGYVRMAEEHSNVYLDLAFSLAPRGLVSRLTRTVDAARITLGSDALFFSLTHQIGKVLGADISEQDKKLILHDNAEAILGRIQR